MAEPTHPGGDDESSGLLWADAYADTTAGGPAPQGPTSAPIDRETSPLDEDRVVVPRREPTPGGFRGLRQRFRGPDPDPGPDRWQLAVERCRQPAPGGRRIAVVSRKGGVGKTTTTLMIGHTLAAVRRDRVLAVDGNPDAGTLGHRVPRQTAATVVDALAAVGTVVGYPDARQLTSQAPSRLEVLASPENPHSSRSLSGRDYQQVLDEMHRHFSVVLCDTGTGIIDDAHSGILDAVDQIVLVSGTALDTARAAGLTLDWLEGHGRAALVRDAVVVVNHVADAGRVDLDAIEAHFRGRTRALHHVPHDRHLEAGAVTDPDQLRPDTQAAWLDVAASVADGFPLPSPRDLRKDPS